MNLENWRPVKGFENYYEVSDLGRLRSVGRTQEIANRWGTSTVRMFKPRHLQPVKCGNGYLSFTLCGDNVRRRSLIHRIVLSSFCPREDEDSMQVNHKNGIRDDNRLLNLEWLTCSDNIKHAHKFPSRKPHALLTPCALVQSGIRLPFDSFHAAARHLGVDPGSVSSAFRRGHKVRGFEVTA